MTETALIGSSCTLGRHWTSRGDFDYVVNGDDLHLLAGRAFGMLAIIDPALQTGPLAARKAPEKDAEAVAGLVRRLGDIKADRAVFVTTADLLPEDGDENAAFIPAQGDVYLESRRALFDCVNLRFGRALNLFIPEPAIPDPAFSMLGALKNPPGEGDLPIALLEYHQLYPLERLARDIGKLLPLGVSRAVAAMPPLTSSELVEALAPALANRQPNTRKNDPKGSRRKSVLSFHWLDPRDGFLTTKEALLAELAQTLL